VPGPKAPGAEMTPEQIRLLVDLIRTQSLPGAHLEVGTAAGVTLAAMAAARPAERHPVFVVVDNMRYFQGQEDVVRSNLAAHGVDPERVDLRIADSGRAFRAAERAGETFDFMVIDASHRICRVTDDLRWTRLLRPGGVACLHDYGPAFPGVVRAVDRFLARHANYEPIARVGSLLALRKVTASRRPEVTLADRAWAALWSIRLRLARRA